MEDELDQFEKAAIQFGEAMYERERATQDLRAAQDRIDSKKALMMAAAKTLGSSVGQNIPLKMFSTNNGGHLLVRHSTKPAEPIIEYIDADGIGRSTFI